MSGGCPKSRAGSAVNASLKYSVPENEKNQRLTGDESGIPVCRQGRAMAVAISSGEALAPLIWIATVLPFRRSLIFKAAMRQAAPAPSARLRVWWAARAMPWYSSASDREDEIIQAVPVKGEGQVIGGACGDAAGKGGAGGGCGLSLLPGETGGRGVFCLDGDDLGPGRQLAEYGDGCSGFAAGADGDDQGIQVWQGFYDFQEFCGHAVDDMGFVGRVDKEKAAFLHQLGHLFSGRFKVCSGFN